MESAPWPFGDFCFSYSFRLLAVHLVTTWNNGTFQDYDPTYSKYYILLFHKSIDECFSAEFDISFLAKPNQGYYLVIRGNQL